jgi:hypothetical protein
MGLFVNRYTYKILDFLSDLQKCGMREYIYLNYLAKNCKFDTKAGKSEICISPQYLFHLLRKSLSINCLRSIQLIRNTLKIKRC